MRFLVDAQLPQTLAVEFRLLGHDAIHTLELPEANATPDEEIRHIARQNDMVVVSKDDDFVNSHILLDDPQKLLFISTGNISNPDLLAVLRRHFNEIVEAFSHSGFVELNRVSLVVHQSR